MSVGMNIACLEAQSTITRIELKPLDIGSSSMKSMDIESQEREGTGSGCKSQYGQCLGDLFCAQVTHDLQ